MTVSKKQPQPAQDHQKSSTSDTVTAGGSASEPYMLARSNSGLASETSQHIYINSHNNTQYLCISSSPAAIARGCLIPGGVKGQAGLVVGDPPHSSGLKTQ